MPQEAAARHRPPSLPLPSSPFTCPHHPHPPYRCLPLPAAGNSPVQIHKKQFAAISDAWFKLSIAIKNDTEADREFGWVQEM